MAIAYLVLGVVWLLLNGAIYLCAAWMLWRGLKERKLYFFVWPILLIAANLYVGLIYTAEENNQLTSLNNGIVYATSSTPKHIEFAGYHSSPYNVCNEICVELLLEQQVQYVTMTSISHDAKLTKVIYERTPGNCFDYPNAESSLKQAHLFYGYCLRPTTASTDPDISIVADQDLRLLDRKQTKGLEYIGLVGIAILQGGYPGETLLALHAIGATDVVAVPLLFKVMNGDGMEGALQLDSGFMTRQLGETVTTQLSRITIDKSDRSYRELERDKLLKKMKRRESRRIEATKYKLMNTVLGLDLDREIGLPTTAISVVEAESLIRSAFKGHEDRLIERAVRFAQIYAGFPFLDLMQTFAAGDSGRGTYLAQSYVDRWVRETDPKKYRETMVVRKQARLVEKAKHLTEKNRRFCKLESRRDGRDCSQYQIEEN